MPAQENKLLVQRFYDLLNRRDWDGIDALMAVNIIDRHPAPCQRLGREGVKDTLKDFINAFPDIRFVMEDFIAEGDKVAARGCAQGTHRETYLGIPASGQRISINGIDVYEVVDGQLTSIHHHADIVSVMVQIGAIPDINR